MKRIVVIDNNVMELVAMRTTLQDAGFEVVGVKDPTRVDILGERPPDLVLVSASMPQVQSDDLVRLLETAWGVRSSVFLYSSLEGEELAQRARKAGASGYISKIGGMDKLVAAVREILRELPLAGSSPKAERAAAGAGPADRKRTSSVDEEPATIYQRFVGRCEERKKRIHDIVQRSEIGELEGGATLHAVNLELHDWVGEATLLGFDKLSTAVGELMHLIEVWGDAFRPGIQGTQLRTWVDQLTEISRSIALEPPSSRLSDRLSKLMAELGRELGSSEFADTTDTTPIPSKSPSAMQRRRILVFDDSPLVGEVLRSELESRGHHVVVAMDHEEFERRLNDSDPEIIFLDVNMPGMKGDAVCRNIRLRSGDHSVPIILLSSLSESELAVLAKRAGATGYFCKQHGVDELIKYLDGLLSQFVF